MSKLRADSLLDQLMKCSRMPWYWATAIVAAVLFLSLFLVAYLDGFFVLGIALSKWNFWERYVDSPIMIIYILIVYPFMRRLRDQAIQAFRSLLPQGEGVSNRLAMETFIPNRRWEWVAVLIGIALWIPIEQSAGWWWGRGTFWLNVYQMVTFPLLFGLLSWLIYDTLTGALRLSRLSRQDLKLDIFNPGQLIPVARSSLGISLALFGGISLSMVFETRKTLLQWDDMTIYAILVCLTVLAFFLSLRSAHNAMARAKSYQLAIARKHLAVASHELESQVAQDQFRMNEELSSAISARVSYERRVKEAPEWPFNTRILRWLIASTLVPAVVYLIKVFTNLEVPL